MIETPDDLRSLLRGTALEEREIVVVDVPIYQMDARSGHVAAPETVLAMRIAPSEVLPVWRVARDLLDQTGRWPLVTCSWDFEFDASSDLGSIVEVLDRVEFGWELAGPADPASIIERSMTVDVEDEIATLARNASWLEDPDPSAVAEPATGYMDWFEPENQLMAMLWLPAAAPEDALAYVHWHAGNNNLPSHVLVAVMRRWCRRFGAELVAHWGTMLQLLVHAPPASVDEALTLARQQELIAPCTTALPGVSTEQHAATLLASDSWFLHERP